MDVKAGYKLTDVGVIPENWNVLSIDECTDYVDYRGKTPQKSSTGVLLVTARNIRAGHIDYKTSQEYISESEYELAMRRGKPRIGDVLITTEAPLGMVALVDREDIALAQRVVKYRVKEDKVFSGYLKFYFLSSVFQTLLEENSSGTTAKGIKGSILHGLPVVLPTLEEQEAIAGALSDADALIEALGQLIAKKRQIKQGAMQALLTGKRRLPGFTGMWQVAKIDDIATPTSERNDAALELPVLTCSKHLGFVDSLRYFKNQVFSDDLSTYKMIRRGQIGYPANHVEEGSIGHQDLYDIALVSPIYVVFSVKEGVNSFFLHRVLKLDAYRQKFKTATTSSIDRRGSLRWPAFSQIEVELPEISEQEAIAGVLSDMDAEIAALDDKLNKARQIKQGMMQELLTGRIRLNGGTLERRTLDRGTGQPINPTT